MVETYPGLEAALSALERRLPMRALQTIRNEQGDGPSEEMLKIYGITDDTIGELLRVGGVEVRQLIEGAIAERHTPDALRTAEDVFSLIDSEMRDENNPLIEAVRGLIHEVISD